MKEPIKDTHQLTSVHHNLNHFFFIPNKLQLDTMVSADFIVGILGNIISIVSYGAPIGQFREMVKNKSSENYDGSPYVTTLLSCCLWTFYGLLDPDDGVLIVTVSVVGVVSQIIFLVLLLIYYSKEKKVKYIGFIMLDLVFFGAIMAITLVAFHDGARRTFMGVTCATFTIIMYAAPLTVVRTTIATKSVEFMPFLLILSLFINGIVWLAFALLVHDIYVLVPNAAGIVLGGIQLSVYFWYKKAMPSSKSTDVVAEKCSTDRVKQEIEFQDSGNKDLKIKVGSESVNTQSCLRNQSISRQYSFKMSRSLSRNPSSKPCSNSNLEDDVEMGGIN